MCVDLLKPQVNSIWSFSFSVQIASEAAKLEGRSLELREQIQSLWTRLSIPQEEQLSFNQAHEGHKPRVIAIVCVCVCVCMYDPE